jgi:hypothetical protein
MFSSNAEPTSYTLDGAGSPTLKDAFTLAGGYHPTGTITFTLYNPGGALVDTETATVSGDGTYATPAGYTLPATGTVTGTYQWDATYSGDGNNLGRSDANATSEQPTVFPASPILATTPDPSSVTNPAGGATLTDTADLEGGHAETGTITFTLYSPGGVLLDTEKVTVHGNGVYVTPTGYTLPTTGPVAGTYQWDAAYSGDTSNTTAGETNDPVEQVTVNKATPTLTTIPNPEEPLLGTTALTLTDTATLAGGDSPTGTITFTLYDPSGTLVDTETATVNGNGAYAAPTGYTLPTDGTTVTGFYQWDATYSGDVNNSTVSDNNDGNEEVYVDTNVPPTIVTTPNQTGVTLGATAPPTLTDTADLEGGYFPTGTITFTLYDPNGKLVDTETVPVNGNGSTYTTPTGYTLPTTGTVAGTYQWDATYSGDGNNNSAREINDPDEEVFVQSASPTLTTAPSPGSVANPGSGTVTLTDTADLEGGYQPGGTITFTLYDPSGTLVDTETATVGGNGTYTTPTGYTLTATAAGTYQWDATYSGDANNNGVSDNSDPAEQVPVGSPSPTISSTPDATLIVLDGTGAPTLTDTATLANGSSPTGTITFTLYDPGGKLVDTETATVNGNGSYTTPTGYTLPTAGTVTGTYQWDATYSGDSNNPPATDNNDPAEQVVVGSAEPTMFGTSNPSSVTNLGSSPVTLTETIPLEDGYFPTGTLTFTLVDPNFNRVDTETVTVTGNGTYTTPTGYTLTAGTAVAGTYYWETTYSGDGNNLGPESFAPVPVTLAAPTLTTPSQLGVFVLSTQPVALTETVTLAGGSNETGTITFTLHDPGGKLVDTETATVNGDGSYKTPTGYTLPTTGTVAGIYQWDATYTDSTKTITVSDTKNPNGTATVFQANPRITSAPNETSVTLGTTTPVLKDTADLEGGYFATGTITFTLHDPSGAVVDMEPVTVHGNGVYTTPTGYTLPATGTVVGTYQWDVAYSGDGNNSASDNSDPAGQVAVAGAAPKFSSNAEPTSYTLDGAGAPILKDTFTLAGGYHPTGTITFTLYKPGGALVDTETATANGNGTYRTPAGYTLPAGTTVTGTYRWDASYSGDANNTAGASNSMSQQTVLPASPLLVTTPDSESVNDLGDVPLTDTADLEGGFAPTGTLTFTLYAPGGALLDTETVTVHGNGTYTTPAGYTLPSTGTVTGTYQWDASYSGDANNVTAGDNNDPAEQVQVITASPLLTTTPNPTRFAPGAATPTLLTDTAYLDGGLDPTGSITFTLYGPGNTLLDTETVTVHGDGTYTTPTGYTLPADPSVTFFQWDAAYSGDAHNSPAGDNNDPYEQVSAKASPTLTTIASPDIVTPGTATTLFDVAFLQGGDFPTGSITFTLYLGGTLLDTETVAVTGGGLYSTVDGYALPATAAPGIYQWDATYSGDNNNLPATDNNDPAEQVAVSPGPVPRTPVIPVAISPHLQPQQPGPAVVPAVAPSLPAQQPPPFLLVFVALPAGFAAEVVALTPPLATSVQRGDAPTPHYLWPLGGSDKAYPPGSPEFFGDLMGVDVEIEPVLRPPIKPIKNISSLLDADDNVRLAETILGRRRPTPAAPPQDIPAPGGMPPEEQEADAALLAADLVAASGVARPESRSLAAVGWWLLSLGLAAGAGIGLLWRRRRGG